MPTPIRAIDEGSGTALSCATFVACVAPLNVRGELAKNTSLGAFVVTKENSNPGVSGMGVPFVWFAGEKVMSTVPGNKILSLSIVRPPVEMIDRPDILAKGVSAESVKLNFHSLAVAVGGTSEKNPVVVTVIEPAWPGTVNARPAINAVAKARRNDRFIFQISSEIGSSETNGSGFVPSLGLGAHQPRRNAIPH
jgi:hypothetical protein